MNRNNTSEIVYYNLSFLNNTSDALIASATETRNTAIIENPKDWLMSVIRFDIDTHTVPINIVALQTGSTTASTSYVTLRYQGVDYTQNISITFSSNSPPFTFNNTTNLIYAYQDFLDRVNNALAAAFASTGAMGSPPIYIYNGTTGLIDLYLDSNFIPAAGPNQITIFLNKELYIYLTNYQYIFTSASSLKYAELVVTDNNIILEPAVGSRTGLPNSVQAITNLYLYRQLAPSTGGWTSLRSLILSSTLLPYRPESIPNNSTTNQNYNSSNLFPILSDFLVPIESSVTNNRIISEYIPTAEYRYIDLTSNNPLYTIDLTLYWSDFLGNIYPLYLLPGAAFSAKILFKKKSLIRSK